MKRAYLLLIICLLAFSRCGSKHENCNEHQKHHPKKLHTASEIKNVEAAILDYVEALYQADSTRIENSVSPKLRKVGYWFNNRDSSYRDNTEMTYQQLVSLAARWNVDGKRTTKNSPKEIEIYEIYDKTASARLVAEWGIDFFHLGKFDGKWQIVNVMWQSTPKSK